MRNSLARLADQGIVAATTFFQTNLAEAEAEAGQTELFARSITSSPCPSEPGCVGTKPKPIASEARFF
jgi:hypothetical protein